MGKCKRLSAVLVAGYLCHDLCRYVTCGKKAVRLFDHRLTDHRTVLQHIFQIDQVTVVLFLRKIIGVVEVDDPRLMRLHDLLGKQYPLRKVFADFSRHIISLCRVDDRVLVGILLLYFLIDMLQ